MNETTWGSKNAEDMYRIAVKLAGFDAKELMVGINQRSKSGKVNLATVLAAMQKIDEEVQK